MNYRDHYPSESPRWSSIAWTNVDHHVERLQIRMTKAAERGEFRRVRNLQRLLDRSLAGRLKAVRSVAQGHRPKRSPGVGGMIWTKPDHPYRAALELGNRSTTKPLRRVTKPKTNNERWHLVPIMDDRAHQALWLNAVLPAVIAHSDRHSYGFRQHRNCRDANAQLRHLLDKRTSPTWVLGAKLGAPSLTINHDWLQAHTPMDRKLLKCWLKAGTIENAKLTPTESGSQVGGGTAPTLANLTLDGLEDHLRSTFPNGSRGRTLINVVRYADEFIVTGRSPRQLLRVKASINVWLQPRGLWLNEDETGLAHIESGFDFLGWNVRKVDGRLRMTVSKASMRRHRRAVKRLTKTVHNPVLLIGSLNHKSTGWMRYHRCCNGLWRVWRAMNNYRYRCLKVWGTKRHSNKTGAWVWRRYWRRTGGRWTFQVKDHDGSDHKLKPYNLIQVQTGRRVRGSTNGFDQANVMRFVKCS